MKISARETRDNGTQLLVESQSAFTGGMNLYAADTDVAEGEYVCGFNFSSRNSSCLPFKGDVEIGANISGKKQGLYAIGSYLILFANGFAYYKSNDSNQFTRIENFRMDANVSRFYVAFVPASSLHFQRALDDANDTESVYIDPAITVNGSPQGLVVQDGINQPQLIFLDGISVQTKILNTFDKWQQGNREYVPVGLDMMYLDGILFVVSKDRSRLYRSVTNRPLDFVVNVTASGDKGGDVETTNYSVSYARINALYPLGVSSFMLCSDAPFSYQIDINREKTIFGEPTFNPGPLFSTSAVNGVSIVDVLGDTAIITQRGIRSFNASRQNKVESQNAIFSLKLNRAFTLSEGKRLLQDENSAAIVFDDYAMFSLNTVYGYAIGVYDVLSQVWCSFLLLTNSNGKVKQFASLLPQLDELYAITSDDKILRLFSGNALTAFIATKKWASGDIKLKQKLSQCDLVIENQPVDGVLNISGVVDNKLAETKSKALVKSNPQPVYSTEFPFNEDMTEPNKIHIEFATNPRIGWKIGYSIAWSGGGELSALQHTGVIDATSLDQLQKTLA